MTSIMFEDRWLKIHARGRTRFVWVEGVLLFGFLGMGLVTPTVSGWLRNGWPGVVDLSTDPRWWSVLPVQLPIMMLLGYMYGTHMWTYVERRHLAGSPTTPRP